MGREQYTKDIVIKDGVWADVRAWGAICDGVTDDAAAIEAAITGGATRIFLPAGTLWIPTLDTIAGGLEIIGEDQNTCIIKSNDVTNNYVTIGAGTSLSSVAVYDKFGADLVAAGSMVANAARPLRFHANNRTSTAIKCANYPDQHSVVYTGETGSDRPAYAVNNFGKGDSFWTGVKEDLGVGFRADVNEDDPTDSGKGFYCVFYGAGSAFQGVAKSGATGKLVNLTSEDDVVAFSLTCTADTTNDITQTTNAKTAGVIVSLYQTTSVFTGIGINMDFGNGAGSFTGQFLNCKVAGVSKASIDKDGDLLLAGGVQFSGKLVAGTDGITATSEGVAASVDTDITWVTTNGDSDLDNVTLADGVAGQIKHIVCVAEGNAADTWKITPATMCGGTQITFAGAGEGCILVYNASVGWVVAGNNGGTIS